MKTDPEFCSKYIRLWNTIMRFKSASAFLAPPGLLWWWWWGGVVRGIGVGSEKGVVKKVKQGRKRFEINASVSHQAEGRAVTYGWWRRQGKTRAQNVRRKPQQEATPVTDSQLPSGLTPVSHINTVFQMNTRELCQDTTAELIMKQWRRGV